MSSLGNAWQGYKNLSQKAGQTLGSAVGQTKEWIVKNPKTTAAIVATLVAPPLAAAGVGPIVHGIGFGASGVMPG
jgi:hypothetical protein